MTANIENKPVTIQFGNPCDTHGFKIVKGEVIATSERFLGKVYLVKHESTYGVASVRNGQDAELDENGQTLYHCTNAMTLGGIFRGHEFTAEDLSRHLGFPVELFV